MKNKLFTLVSFLCLLFISPALHAGFAVKRSSVVHNAAAHVYTNASTIATSEKASGFIAKVNKALSFLRPYRTARSSEWVGIAALGCGIIGLLVPGLNLSAILFGVLGMGRGCKVQGLAVTGFILGVVELVLFLIAGVTVLSLILL